MIASDALLYKLKSQPIMLDEFLIPQKLPWSKNFTMRTPNITFYHNGNLDKIIGILIKHS